jgi:hypothetical protein
MFQSLPSTIRDDRDKECPFVVIDWLDASGPEGWNAGEPIKDVMVCRTAGWLLRNTTDMKVISGTVARSGDGPLQYHAPMGIPTCAVLRIRRVTQK